MKQVETNDQEIMNQQSEIAQLRKQVQTLSDPKLKTNSNSTLELPSLYQSIE